MSSYDRVTVVGVGGIGGSMAAFLALAGERVTVVDRAAEHLEAIRANGLRIDGYAGEHVVRFDQALFPEELTGPLDLVILAVKSQHTADAVATLAPLLSEDGVIVSIQNGWNPRWIAEVVGSSRTLGTMVHMVANHVGPGHITRFREGEFFLGELDGSDTERAHSVGKLISKAVPTHVTTNVWGYIWSKQVYGTCLVATALVDAPSSEITQPEWVRRVLLGLILEGMEVARAEGIKLEVYDRFDPAVMQVRSKDDLPAALDMVPKGSAKGNSGIWHDIKVRHRKTETDYLTGELVRLGRKHGLPMTLNGCVAEMIAEIEDGKRQMSWDNLRSLEDAANKLLPV